MFKSFKFLVLIFAFALSLSSAAHAKDTATQAANRKAIMAAYTNTNAALMRRDVERVISLCADDFVYYTKSRLAKDRAAYAQEMAISLSIPNVRYSLAKTDITKIVWRGPDAVVYSTQITQLKGPNGVVHVRTKFRDYWGKTSRGWQVRQAVELSGVTTLNGVVISR